ncbi:hypothetical protein KBB96_16965 [Luteolibacter ambystomatis]|uniref:Metallopeptidase n=1 Tax=Luteolibacter ambystomatis TaxID=2824561 RepID=A0A975G832_9BACT|nr:hypothetical protein [Luteolibacter ambystomatis]QUE50542.1 hypothetical protein KBB96_16965 [Luteolibacter ambystomatis]
MRNALLLFIAMVLPSGLVHADAPSKPAAHQHREIEGWQVDVDQRLLEGPQAELGDRALKLLRNRLEEIGMVVPPDKVERLRKVPIQLDATYGGLHTMQYHPSAGWLKANGYDEALAKKVHIPDAADFASLRHHHTQPWCVLHELAHAYHDQVLGFDNPDVMAVWKEFVASGKYTKTRFINGGTQRHYALTDQKEFFAEMTEAYFGTNDFFPFNRADLRDSEPGIFAQMKKTWGDLP